jgi:hypothetical protein
MLALFITSSACEGPAENRSGNVYVVVAGWLFGRIPGRINQLRDVRGGLAAADLVVVNVKKSRAAAGGPQFTEAAVDKGRWSGREANARGILAAVVVRLVDVLGRVLALERRGERAAESLSGAGSVLFDQAPYSYAALREERSRVERRRRRAEAQVRRQGAGSAARRRVVELFQH